MECGLGLLSFPHTRQSPLPFSSHTLGPMPATHKRSEVTPSLRLRRIRWVMESERGQSRRRNTVDREGSKEIGLLGAWTWTTHHTEQ